MKRLCDLGEEGFILRLARKARTDRSVLRGIGDDCAVLRWRGSGLLLFASDMLVEGVHFRRTAPPEAIGWKALAVNVSDVAAMGGLPRHAVISLGLPKTAPLSYADGLYRGLRRCARRFGVNLVGGDTVRAPRVVVDVAILGEVERGRVVYRTGARPGDWLLVTGRLGGAVRNGKHLRFTPRVREARALGRRARIHAMIDLSDGLGPDLVRLCQAGRVSAVLESRIIPRAPGCSLAAALNEGEDFELLMAAPPREAERLLRWGRRNLRCGLHRIGWIVRRQKGVPVILRTGTRTCSCPQLNPQLNLAGFQHF